MYDTFVNVAFQLILIKRLKDKNKTISKTKFEKIILKF